MKLKKFFTKFWELFLKFIKNKNVYFVLLSIVPFISLDICTRLFTAKIDFVKFSMFEPWFFTSIWCLFFVGFALSFKKNIAKTLYVLFFIVSYGLFLVHNVYYSMTEEIFDFHLMELASEGSSYFMDAVKGANPKIYLSAVGILALFIFCVIKLPTLKKNNYYLISCIPILFIIIHIFAPNLYGQANTGLAWNSWYNHRNIYINFNDSNKSFSITGMYEYSFRNFYLTFLAKEKTEDETQKEFLNTIFSEEETEYKNEYTGKFKGKNVIFLQLEGIDNWLVTKETMPNLYNLMKKSINFTNHYSYYNGGGSTFNSEFAVNTGYLTPITYTRNAYTFNKNTFTYSMARLFKKEGYNVNAFHMNSGEYYSRIINYKSWGFDHYYSLQDTGDYTDNAYYLDRELVLNEKFYDLLFKQEGNFVSYIISYSNHMPFSSEKGVCKQILDLKAKEEYETLTEEEKLIWDSEIKEEKIYTEEECIRIQAGETDYFISLLMKGLEDNGLLDNTIIVAYADHYLYTVSDKAILDQYKNTSNNLINQTPFFIWSNDLKKTKKITKVTSQVNILPTVLNLMGLEYHPNYYTGEDALNKSYEGIAFFSDYSWYDGKLYVDGNGVSSNNKVDVETLNKKNEYVDYLIKKNDWVLKYDYFKYLNKKTN